MRPLKMSLVTRAAVACAAVAGIALGLPASPADAGPVPAILGFALGDTRPIPGIGEPVFADSGSTLGWSFVPTALIEITSLGFYDSGHDGFEESHLVGVWDAEGALLASGMLARGDQDPRIGDYRYAAIEPLPLEADNTYVIGATVPLGLFLTPTPLQFDTYPYHNLEVATLATRPEVTIISPSLHFLGSVGPDGSGGPGTLNFPDQAREDGYYLAPNFTFTVIPEPSVMFMLSLGVALLFAKRRISCDGHACHNAQRTLEGGKQ